MKGQNVRLLDVLIFGPVMIAFALKRSKLTNTERAILGAIGAGTIFYNWHNFRKQLEHARQIEER